MTNKTRTTIDDALNVETMNIDTLLSKMNLKDVSKPGISTFRVRGEYNGATATLSKRMDDERTLYSFIVITPTQVRVNETFEHYVVGPNEGNPVAMTYFANYAADKIEKFSTPFLPTGSTGEYKNN